jgi:hypothetical protein
MVSSGGQEMGYVGLTSRVDPATDRRNPASLTDSTQAGNPTRRFRLFLKLMQIQVIHR